jgi:LuxR family transcriptional regulator, maltose regulon positive regulatory protein
MSWSWGNHAAQREDFDGTASKFRWSCTGPLVFDSRQLRFLATKIMPPRCPGLIERPRLLDVASQLPTKRLSVIRAPAGFGKTSLAASWSECLRERGNLVAWFAIDSDDDDPHRFLFYMMQAMHRATSSVGADALQLIGESLLLDPQAIVSADLSSPIPQSAS